MARSVEESIMKAMVNAFPGTKVSSPNKSYMAIGTSIPRIGEAYNCKRLEKDSKGDIKFRSIITTRVQDIQQLAGNVFVVVTKNTYYVTRVLYMPTENVHLAIVANEPQIGASLSCYKLEFRGEEGRTQLWTTTAVQNVKCIHGLYKVRTENSTYICFPM